ncbi:bro-b [Leucania separata nucleopolyhedrovirus]|uniref:Bro-b n=1 Tax=Leucania separata nucleopolyhedrovirus TaxID=1307956 RepID=Q0IL69_NPVLS|nr:bro-b [Leucania separata nucleopolyhedrovirus]AAR28814.1 bro-b [Leucania separata nucleopolyhedrovirus]
MNVQKTRFANVDIEIVSTESDQTVWMLAEPFVKLFKYTNSTNRVVGKHVSPKNMKYASDDERFKNSEFINCTGVLELLCRSRMKYAREFSYWLINVLLPSLCKNPIERFEEWKRSSAEQVRSQVKPLNMRGCVYIVTNEMLKADRLYKIGCTFELRDCLFQLDSASPYDFYAEHLQLTEDCVELERRVFERFADRRLCRGFFRLDERQLRTVIDYCKRFSSNKSCASTNN